MRFSDSNFTHCEVMYNYYIFLGATLNLGVILPKIGYKALWKLGVAPKLALNDGQKWVVVRRSKFVQLNLQI